MTAAEQLAMTLYLMQPVQVTSFPIPGGPPWVTRKMWDECTDEERRPCRGLAADILSRLPAWLADEARDHGT